MNDPDPFAPTDIEWHTGRPRFVGRLEHRWRLAAAASHRAAALERHIQHRRGGRINPVFTGPDPRYDPHARVSPRGGIRYT